MRQLYSPTAAAAAAAAGLHGEEVGVQAILSLEGFVHGRSNHVGVAKNGIQSHAG